MSQLNNQTNLAQLLMRAFYWVDEGLQNILRENGWSDITRAQSLVFVNVGEGVTRPSEIASRVGVTRQAVHQTINELINMDLVDLQPDPHDRRAKVVTYTERGSAIGKDAVAALREIEGQLIGRIGDDRVGFLRDALAQDWGASVGMLRER